MQLTPIGQLPQIWMSVVSVAYVDLHRSASTPWEAITANAARDSRRISPVFVMMLMNAYNRRHADVIKTVSIL